MESKQPTKQNIFDLIELITPLNNHYRDLIKSSESGADVLLLMWQVGDIIGSFIEKYGIKPHNLYWQIYGKAEGLKTSYITRDFLSYCLRIRRYFQKTEDISEKFPLLQRYSLFREGFPLLENPKFKLSGEEKDEVIRILNSKHSPKKIKILILEIKDRRIGIKNTRKQKLNEMKVMTDNFVVIYNEVYSLIKNDEQEALEKFTHSIQRDLLVTLSQAVSALTQENLYIPGLEEKNDLPDHWDQFVKDLKYLFSSSVEVRNRFRRLVPPRKLFDLADMLNAFVVDRGIINYRKQKNLQ